MSGQVMSQRGSAMRRSAVVPRAPSFRAVPFLKTAAETRMIQLTERQREELLQIGTRVRLPPRKVVYHEQADADWVFAVLDGTVKCYRDLPSGKRALCAFLFPDDLFGLSEQGKYLNTAQAITQVTLFRLSLSQLTQLLRQDADLQFQFLAKVTHELRESQRRAILLNRRDAAGRLAMFLGLISHRAGRSVGREWEIPLPMSRTDIAGFLGLSLESVSRAAAELEHRGFVKFEGRHRARILDAPRLRRLASAV